MFPLLHSSAITRSPLPNQRLFPPLIANFLYYYLMVKFCNDPLKTKTTASDILFVLLVFGKHLWGKSSKDVTFVGLCHKYNRAPNLYFVKFISLESMFWCLELGCELARKGIIVFTLSSFVWLGLSRSFGIPTKICLNNHPLIRDELPEQLNNFQLFIFNSFLQ